MNTKLFWSGHNKIQRKIYVPYPLHQENKKIQHRFDKKVVIKIDSVHKEN